MNRSYWLRLWAKNDPNFLPWLFHRDYTLGVLCLLLYSAHFLRSSVVGFVYPWTMTLPILTLLLNKSIIAASNPAIVLIGVTVPFAVSVIRLTSYIYTRLDSLNRNSNWERYIYPGLRPIAYFVKGQCCCSSSLRSNPSLDSGCSSVDLLCIRAQEAGFWAGFLVFSIYTAVQ